ncbi:MAG: hypothetical protein HYX72_00580 [Acidobacteria bacterium]|nr:hypothetical protein [Acidobacteriota bacterium]
MFARLAKGGDMPVRLLAGQSTKLSRTMHDIRYDAAHDEFVVTNPFAQAVLTFAGDVNGDAAPKRIIQGPKTQLSGSDRLDVDPVHNEIIVPMGDSIGVYSREANGDVAPLRMIKGPDTMLRQATSAVVDPVNNLLVVGLNSGTNFGESKEGEVPNGAILIFNRTDNGNVKPRAVIKGPKSGITRINQIALNPARKLIVATQPGPIQDMEPKNAYVGIWNMDDNGDVPPRWRINANAKSEMKKPRGVVLNPKHKELIIADMRLNAVLTYYFPEIF